MSPHFVIILFELVVMVFALSVHEAAHAWMASRLGDQTARMMGRVTLNPASHVDPIGTIAIPLIAMIYGWPLIGWAKPTPVQPRNFARYKRDSMLVTLAGPVSNLLQAILFLAIIVVLKHTAPGTAEAIDNARMAFGGMPLQPGSILQPVVLALYTGVVINVLLFVFNLVPIPPLDGSHIVDLYLPPRLSAAYANISRFSTLILMLLVWLGFFGIVYGPVINLFENLINVL